MIFEEFFKKKRIDLAALEKAEPALFSEFKTHFGQMGEKSFDHTKKYWFNKLRRQFQLAPEVKTEKVLIQNPIAEQTITESLTEAAPPAPSPKIGFVPKFRAANIPKPVVAEDKKDDSAVPSSDPQNLPAGNKDETAIGKPAYQPRFKMKSKIETEENNPEPTAIEPPPAENIPEKPAYKPRFNMNKIPPKQQEE